MSRVCRRFGYVRHIQSSRVVAFAVCTLISAVGPTVAAQGLQYVMANPSTPDPQGFLGVVSPAICSDSTSVLPVGGYLKTGTQITIDAHAVIGGVCQFWFNNVHYPQYDYTRGINAIKTYYTVPGQSPNYSPRWAPCCQDQDYDTRNPMGGSGSLTKTPATLGSYLVDIQTNPFETNCHYIQDSSVVTMSFDVMACKPTFQIDSNGNIGRLAPTTISIDLPSGMSAAGTALGDAIDEWNNGLGGTGVVLQASSCSAGPHCVPVTANPVLTSCGLTPSFSTDGDGVITSGAEIQLNSNWTTYTLQSLRRTFIHEIGHLLGLSNYPSNASCTASAAAMNETFTCGSASTPMDDVTCEDHRPVTKTAYGAYPRVSCGF